MAGHPETCSGGSGGPAHGHPFAHKEKHIWMCCILGNKELLAIIIPFFMPEIRDTVEERCEYIATCWKQRMQMYGVNLHISLG